LIITSPPYGSAQKYIRATSLSLNWLGFALPHELSNLEGQSIGREHIPSRERDVTNAHIPDAYQKLLRRVQNKDETRAKITRRYLCEMSSALSEMARVTAPGGRIVLIVGNNQVCGEPLQNDIYITHLLEGLGLRLEIGLVDNIKSRGLMTKRNKTASLISRESVLVFTK
jgi:DNA modification methylase